MIKIDKANDNKAYSQTHQRSISSQIENYNQQQSSGHCPRLEPILHHPSLSQSINVVIDCKAG